jgi:4-hydroxybenzoate polyprenyltransferase
VTAAILCAVPGRAPSVRPTVAGVVGALARSCHPGPTVVVTLATTVLAAAAGHGPGRFLLVGAAILSGQLSIGWLNDLLDARRDRAAHRTDKPLAQGELPEHVVRRAVLLVTVACVPLSLALGVPAALAHLVMVVSGWAYDLGVKATALSWVPYAAGFGALPAIVTLALPGAPLPPIWAVLSTALLGTGAHFLNVVPDIEEDLRAGVRGLPQRLGATAARVAGAALLATACLVLTFAPPGGAGTVGAALLPVALGLAASAVVLGRQGSPEASRRARTPFLCAVAVAAVALALLVARGTALV